MDVLVVNLILLFNGWCLWVYYVIQVVVVLLIFVIFVNDLDLMYFLYVCYLENWIWVVFDFIGILICLIKCWCKQEEIVCVRIEGGNFLENGKNGKNFGKCFVNGVLLC